MEQLVDTDEARRRALLVMMTQECLEHVSIGIEAVGPEVRSLEKMRFSQSFLDEGQRDSLRT